MPPACSSPWETTTPATRPFWDEFRNCLLPAGERRVNNMIRLTSDPIDYAELTETVRSTASGAVVLFLGTVRELTDGRRTVALDYDAYGPMAEVKLKELETEARRRWPIDQVAIVHRIGRLELGDVSVAVAVSCPHRHDAFEAARFLIDTLKVTVPIWKKENWSDGTTEWVHPGVAPAAENEKTPDPRLDAQHRHSPRRRNDE